MQVKSEPIQQDITEQSSLVRNIDQYISSGNRENQIQQVKTKKKKTYQDYITKHNLRILFDICLVVAVLTLVFYQPNHKMKFCGEVELQLRKQTMNYDYGNQIDFTKMKMINYLSDYNQSQVNTRLSTIELMQSAFFSNMLGKNIENDQNLKKIAQFEIEYYDRKYNIKKYEEEIQICVIVPSFKNQAHNRYKANLDSIFEQNYQNFILVYINDFSPDRTGELVQEYMNTHPVAKQKMILINNQFHKEKSRNQYEAAHKYCKPGSIMIVIDGDDNLIGRQVFKLLNAVYQQRNAGYLSLNFMRFVKSTQNPTLVGGYSIFISDQRKKQRQYRNLDTQMHLRSWMSDLFLSIPEEDYKLNGQFVSMGEDEMSMPLLMELAGDRVQYVPQIVYGYNQDTGNNVSSKNNSKHVCEACSQKASRIQRINKISIKKTLKVIYMRAGFQS